MHQSECALVKIQCLSMPAYLTHRQSIGTIPHHHILFLRLLAGEFMSNPTLAFQKKKEKKRCQLSHSGSHL